MKMQHSKTFAALLAVAFATACSSYPRVEASYGDSVRQLLRNQSATTGPVDTAPPETGDGQRLHNVIQALRSDVNRGGDTPPEPVSIQFGGGAPQSQ